jgi:hypothetical protein
MSNSASKGMTGWHTLSPRDNDPDVRIEVFSERVTGEDESEWRLRHRRLDR